jgi:hypothetical protein
VRRGLKNSNNESMKPTKYGIEEMAASVVPLGRTCYDDAFPGTSSLANILYRFATHHENDGGGKRRCASRAFTGLRGQEIGKWCNFFHLAPASTRLFPHKSTQVVDFPHIEYVRLFWEGVRIGFSSQAELGTNQAGLGSNFWENRTTEIQGQRKLGTKMGRLN